MRRALTMARAAAVYLLAGLVASVVVAWGLAWSPDFRFVFHEESHGGYFPATGVPVFRADASPPDNRSSASRYQTRKHGVVRRSLEFDSTDVRSPMLRENSVACTIHPLGSLMGVQADDTHTQAFLSDRIPPPVPYPPYTIALPHAGAWGDSYGMLVANTESAEPIRIVEAAYGLPALCLWNGWEQETTMGTTAKGQPQTLRAKGGVPLNPQQSVPMGPPESLRVRALPLRPIWAGLAVNTAFYAVWFAGLVFVFKAVRAWRRFNKGLCVRCAYDLRFDYSCGCSECGRGVKGDKVRVKGA